MISSSQIIVIKINLSSKICCKNYSIEEFQTLKTNKTDLKIFHNNMNELENKHARYSSVWTFVIGCSEIVNRR